MTVFILVTPVLYHCSLGYHSVKYTQMLLKKTWFILSGTNTKAKGRMGTSSEWFFFSHVSNDL